MEGDGKVIYEDIDISGINHAPDAMAPGAGDADGNSSEEGFLNGIYKKGEDVLAKNIKFKLPEIKVIKALLSTSAGGGFVAFVLSILLVIVIVILVVFFLFLVLFVMFSFVGALFQTQVDTIEIGVNELTILQSSNSTLDIRVDGAIEGSMLKSSASFKTKDLVLYYGGIMELDIDIDDDGFVRRGDDGYTSFVSLDGLNNQTLVDIIANAFVNQEYLSFQLIGFISVKWGILGHDCVLSKNIEVPGFGSLDIDIYKLSLIEATANTILFNVSILIENPSAVRSALASNGMSLARDGVHLGTLTMDGAIVESGTNEFVFQVMLVRGNDTNKFFSDVMDNQTVPLQVSANFTIIAADGSSGPVFKMEDKVVTLVGQSYTFLDYVKYNSADSTITSSSATLVTDVSITNPTVVPVNITQIYMKIYFDDTVGVLPVYGPKSNVYVGDTTQLLVPPTSLGSNETTVLQMSIVTTDVETCARLYARYSDGSLVLKIRDGMVSMDMFDFSIDLSFELETPVI